LKKLYRTFKDTNLKLKIKNKKINILWYPKITTIEELNRESARILWYVNPVITKINKIYVYVEKNLEQTILENNVPSYIDDSLLNFKQNFKGKICFISDKKSLKKLQYDILMMWKNSFNIKKSIYPYLINGSVEHNQFEANQMMKLSNLFLSSKEKKENHKKLMRLLHRLQIDDEYIYLFGSGPSLNNVEEYNIDFSNTYSIICNSVVKNLDLLSTINPKVIVASDAVFHSGYSKYASEFRKAVMKAIDIYEDLVFIVPLRDYKLYMNNFPLKYTDRIIGIKGIKTKEYNINLFKKQHLKSTSNVLTFMMLPIASTLSKKIRILGFDGKKPEDKNIFWQYDTKSQFTHSIDFTKQAHTSFYNVDYESYYDMHCKEVKALIDVLNTKKILVENLGHSNIPALKVLRKYD
jgi:hypothetical protein